MGAALQRSNPVSILYLLHLAFKEETNEKEDRKSAAESGYVPDHAAGTERICSRDIHRDRDRGSQREHWQPCRESDRWNHRRSERIQLSDPERRFRTYELQWLYPG